MRFSVGVALVFLAGMACSPSASRVVVELEAPLGTSTDIVVTAENCPTLHKTEQGVPRSIGITPTKGAIMVTVKVTVSGVEESCHLPSVTREVTFDLTKLGEHASIALQITCENGNPGTGGQGMGGQGTGGQASGGQGQGMGGQGTGGQANGGAGMAGSGTGGAATGGAATGGQGGNFEGSGGWTPPDAGDTGGGGIGAAGQGVAGASTGGSTVDCPPDAGSSDSAMTEVGGNAGTCDSYCLRYVLVCKGASAAYANQDSCLRACQAATVPPGTITSSMGNTLGCRIFWLTINVLPDTCSGVSIPASTICQD